MSRYPAYRLTSIPWLEELPAGWEERKLGDVATIDDETLTKDTPSSLQFEYVAIGDVVPGIGISTSSLWTFEKAPVRARKIAHKGDLIMSTVRPNLRTIAQVDRELIVSTGFSVIRTRKIDARFLFHVLRADFFVRKSVADTTGTLYPATSSVKIARQYIPLPPLSGQRAIAAYLDKFEQLAQQLEQRLKRQLELVGELRQSVVSEVVSRGLGRDVPLRPTRIPWLEGIPEGWEERRLGDVVDLNTNRNTGLIEDNVLSLSYGHIIRKKNLLEGLLPTSYEGYQIVEAGDIVVRPTDLQNDQHSLRVGSVRERGIITSAYLGLRPRFWPGYIYYALLTADLHKVFYSMGRGVRQTLRFQELATLLIPFPPLSEQRAIAAYLDTFDYGEQALSRRLGLVKELRQSVVSEVVTGQRKVEI